MSFLSDKKNNMSLISKPLACVASKLATKQVKNVITLAGAGISTSAGISDFRSPETGLYNKLRKYKLQFADVMWDKHYFESHPETLFSILKDNFLQNPLKPTMSHCFIKLLETKGVLLRHYTQNIDGMELLTGLPRDKLVEAHGTLHRSYCTSCKQQYDFQWLAKKMEKNPVPNCDCCGSLVRPDIVLFGENLCKDFELRSFIDLPQCDLLIILGTTLQVEPFASLIHNIPTNCPRLVISKHNLSEFRNTKYQRSMRYEKDIDDTLGYDAFLLGDCDTSVHDLVAMIGWEDDFQRVVREVKLKRLFGDVAIVDVGVQTLPISPDDDSELEHREDVPKLTLKCSNYVPAPQFVLDSLSVINFKTKDGKIREIKMKRGSKEPKENKGLKENREGSPEKPSTKTTSKNSKPMYPPAQKRPKKLPTVDQKLLRFCNRCTIHTVCGK